MFQTLRMYLTILAFVLGLGASSFGADRQFTRLEEKGRGAALQTAYATYESDKSDVKIVLYGVVHIGDASYYERVQRDLDSFDIVLWEGVKPENPEMEISEQMRSLGELQKTMGDLLGLTFQKDGIDYERDHFVHADMTYEEFQERLGQGGGGFSPFGNFLDEKTLSAMAPVLKMVAEFGKQFLASNPEMQDMLKMQLAQQLSSTEDVSKMLGGQMGKVILDDRNDVVMKVLKKQLAETKSGTIAIFYGAAHMPDFDARLEKMGFRQSDKRWVSAWNMRGGVASDESLAAAGKAKGKGKKKEPVPSGGSGKGRWF